MKNEFIKVVELSDDMEFSYGTRIRVFGVHRFDIMKSKEDYDNHEKQQQDFYDLLICDAGEKKFFLVFNITSNSSNQGALFCRLEKISIETKTNSYRNKVVCSEVKGKIGLENVFIKIEG